MILVNSDIVQRKQSLVFEKVSQLPDRSRCRRILTKENTYASAFTAILAQGLMNGLTQANHVRSLQIINMKTSIIISSSNIGSLIYSLANNQYLIKHFSVHYHSAFVTLFSVSTRLVSLQNTAKRFFKSIYVIHRAGSPYEKTLCPENTVPLVLKTSGTVFFPYGPT